MGDRGSPWLVTVRFACICIHWWRQLDCVAHSERIPTRPPSVGIPSTSDYLISITVSLAEDDEFLAEQGLGGGPPVAAMIQYGVGVELAVLLLYFELG